MLGHIPVVQQLGEQSEGRAEQLREQAAAAVAVSRSLTQLLADVAGGVAQTEDEVARVQENLAVGPGRVSGAAEHAARAREFAEHERAEQLKLSRQKAAP